MEMLWAIQTNIIHQPDRDNIFKALTELGYPYQGFTAIPFSDSLPSVKGKNAVFCGSTNVINGIYKSGKWNPGTFFNENFDYRVWSDKYKILNSNHQLIKLQEIEEKHFYGTEKHAFIRPVLDLKEFPGDVIEWKKFESWKKSLVNLDLLLDCVCVVTEPFGISKEWRTFIVNGNVVGASQYREYLRLSPAPGAPPDVIKFAESQAAIYSPHVVFVMDVGKSADELYVIEVGCFNSAGSYKCDLVPICKAVQEFIL